VSEAWRNLSAEERSVWEAKAREDKMRYEAEKYVYTGPWKLPFGPKRAKKDPNAPKRPMSAFLFYSQMMRSKVKRENPGLSNTEVSKVLADLWKAAPERERKIHIDKEAEERAVYKVAMKEWREARDAEIAGERKRREDIAREAVTWGNSHAFSSEAQASSSQQKTTRQVVDGASYLQPALVDPAHVSNIHTTHTHMNNE